MPAPGPGVGVGLWSGVREADGELARGGEQQVPGRMRRAPRLVRATGSSWGWVEACGEGKAQEAGKIMKVPCQPC